MSSTSGTDTDVIFWTRGGIPRADQPAEPLHASPVEVVSLKDLEQIPDPRGLRAVVKKGEQFKVKV